MATDQFFAFDMLGLLRQLPLHELSDIRELRLRASDRYHPVHELRLTISTDQVIVGVTMCGITPADAEWGTMLGRATHQLLPEYTATIGDVLGIKDWQYALAQPPKPEITAASTTRPSTLERLLVPLLSSLDLDDPTLEVTYTPIK